MTNMNKREHDIVFPLLVEKFGKKCRKCNKKFRIANPKKLLVDHIDNNNNNKDFGNLQLLCRSCNTKKNHPRTTEPTTRNAPPEFTAGKKNYKKAVKYVRGLMEDPENHNALEYDSLTNDIAACVDCSQQSVKNYLLKMISKRHGSYTTEERNGDLYLVPKNDEELKEVMNMEKYFPDKD